MKNEYEFWLRNIAKKKNGEPYSERTIYKYYSSIDVLSKEFNINFWNNESFDDLISKREYLYANEDFQNKNSIGNHMYSRAIESYLDFIYSKGIDTIKIDIDNIESDSTISYEEKNSFIESICNIRNPQFQHNFRKELLKEFNGKCALCNVDDPRFLIASHIIPYSDCQNKSDMYRAYNGLLLCVTHDALFDKHFITFDNNGNIKINKSIDEKLYSFFSIDNALKLDNIYLTSDRKECLESHNAIFIEKDK